VFIQKIDSDKFTNYWCGGIGTHDNLFKYVFESYMNDKLHGAKRIAQRLNKL